MAYTINTYMSIYISHVAFPQVRTKGIMALTFYFLEFVFISELVTELQ